jgi:hypothetical protein
MERTNESLREPVGWREMNETCDRCGSAVRAAYRVQKLGELYLCRHCAPRLWPTLSAQGWNIWPISASALAPQANEHADADAWRDLDASA